MVSKKQSISDPLLVRTRNGIYCPQADVHIDPWRPVERALITHAHADHARSGSKHYFCASDGKALLQSRLNTRAITPIPYTKKLDFNGVQVSFHPAGHILGSAQIKLDDGNQTWVITGDFKRESDPTCEVFKPIECDVLITEATFALPIYRWPTIEESMQQIFRWWDNAITANRTPVLLCYSLGKAQRIMAEIGIRTDRSVIVHQAIATLNEHYSRQSVRLCPWRVVNTNSDKSSIDLVIAPPQVAGSAFLKRFNPIELAMASGWMQVRGVRRRAAINQGFVISDHTDWIGLLNTVRESKAHTVLATHGETRALTRYLNETGSVYAERLETAFGITEDLDQ